MGTASAPSPGKSLLPTWLPGLAPVLAFGVLARVLAFWLLPDSLANALADHAELASPVTATRRLREGLFLAQNGHSPYAGDVFHGSPIVIVLFSLVQSHWAQRLVLVAADVGVAVLLCALTAAQQRAQHSARAILRLQRSEEPDSPVSKAPGLVQRGSAPASAPSDAALATSELADSAQPDTSKSAPKMPPPTDSGVLLTDTSMSTSAVGQVTIVPPTSVFHYLSPSLPVVVASLYFLSPLTIMGAAAGNYAALTYLAATGALVAACAFSPLLSAFCLATAVVLDFYPVVLAVPIALILRWGLTPAVSRASRASPSSAPAASANGTASLPDNGLGVWLLFGFGLVGFLGLYAAWMYSVFSSSWAFAWASFGFWFRATDLTPSTSTFWYFFTEVFDRFRSFFRAVFHGHALVYSWPLAVRLWSQPLFLAFAALGVCTVFRAYPTFVDLGFVLALFAAQQRLLSYARRFAVIFFWLGLSGAVGALMWFIWIFPGSGNANFYYFQTLVHIMCLSFVIAEATSSARKSLYRQSINGFSRKEEPIEAVEI